MSPFAPRKCVLSRSERRQWCQLLIRRYLVSSRPLQACCYQGDSTQNGIASFPCCSTGPAQLAACYESVSAEDGEQHAAATNSPAPHMNDSISGDGQTRRGPYGFDKDHCPGSQSFDSPPPEADAATAGAGDESPGNTSPLADSPGIGMLSSLSTGSMASRMPGSFSP